MAITVGSCFSLYFKKKKQYIRRIANKCKCKWSWVVKRKRNFIFSFFIFPSFSSSFLVGYKLNVGILIKEFVKMLFFHDITSKHTWIDTSRNSSPGSKLPKRHHHHHLHFPVTPKTLKKTVRADLGRATSTKKIDEQGRCDSSL